MEKYILVVEDDYKSQQLLQQFLTSNGYKVDCANDGLEGIQMFRWVFHVQDDKKRVRCPYYICDSIK